MFIFMQLKKVLWNYFDMMCDYSTIDNGILVLTYLILTWLVRSLVGQVFFSIGQCLS